MKASDWIIEFLARQGVDTIFGYIGGMVTHLVDSAARHPAVHFIQTYHEQSAAFAAEGYARISGIPGVAVATSGPGATNMLTGVGNAYFDSIPVLYITGQVNTCEYKFDKPVRQQGFQETDVVAMAKPITKYAVMITRKEELIYEFEKAWNIARSGRPGPVLIDLPMDLSRAEIDPALVPHYSASPEKTNGISAPDAAQKIADAICRAKRPLLLLGGGSRHAGNREYLERLLEKIPAVVSLQGKGCVREDLPLFIGMLGSYGNRCANLVTAASDLLVVLGSRLDTRQTGAKWEEFGKGRRIIQVDVDAQEMAHHRLAGREVCLLPVEELLPELLRAMEGRSISPEWKKQLGSLKQNYSQEREIERFVDNKIPYQALLKISEKLAPDALLFADVGQNQMWTAQTVCLKERREFFTSGGMAPMGYSIPAAVGAAMADRSHRQICVVTGDGGLQIALQSLPLISQYHLPVTVIVMNNSSLGMITQFQSLYFDSRFAATAPEGGYSAPDCEALSEAFSLKYCRCTDVKQLDQVFASHPDGQLLLEVVIPFPSTVSPKLEYCRPFYDMLPLLPREELALLQQLFPAL